MRRSIDSIREEPEENDMIEVVCPTCGFSNELNRGITQVGMSVITAESQVIFRKTRQQRELLIRVQRQPNLTRRYDRWVRPRRTSHCDPRQMRPHTGVCERNQSGDASSLVSSSWV